VAIVERQLASGETVFWVVVAVGSHRKWFRATDRRAAEHLHEELRVRARRNDLPTADDRIPIGKFARTWIHEGCAHLKPATLRTYESRLFGHLLPALGEHTRLRDALTVARLHQIAALWRQQGLSESNIGNNMTVLSAMCHWAVDLGYLTANPAHRVRVKTPPHREAHRVLEPSALSALVQRTPKEHRSLMVLLCATGMRPQSEAAGLRWQNIDWHRRVIRLDFSMSAGTRTDRPKNGRHREVPMSPAVVAALTEQRAKRLPGELVFPSKTGKNMNMSHWKRDVFIPSAHRAGIATEGLRIYDIRHSVITQMVNAGVPIPVIADVCGTSRQLVLDTYAGVFAGDNQRALDALSAGMFDGTGSPVLSAVEIMKAQYRSAQPATVVS